eukprot:9470094-Pyramimonas_sp.AAC.1
MRTTNLFTHLSIGTGGPTPLIPPGAAPAAAPPSRAWPPPPPPLRAWPRPPPCAATAPWRRAAKRAPPASPPAAPPPPPPVASQGTLLGQSEASSACLAASRASASATCSEKSVTAFLGQPSVLPDVSRNRRRRENESDPAGGSERIFVRPTRRWVRCRLRGTTARVPDPTGKARCGHAEAANILGGSNSPVAERLNKGLTAVWSPTHLVLQRFELLLCCAPHLPL